MSDQDAYRQALARGQATADQLAASVPRGPDHADADWIQQLPDHPGWPDGPDDTTVIVSGTDKA